MRTQELLLCSSVCTHLARIDLTCSSHSLHIRQTAKTSCLTSSFFYSFFFASSYSPRASSVASCKQRQTAHVCAFQFFLCYIMICELYRTKIKVRNPWHSNETKQFSNGERNFVLVLSLVLGRHHWTNGGRRRIMNINMCEHEQNFHALDVAFYSFRSLFAIERSYLEFSVVWTYIFFMIRCSCLKRACG